MSWPASGSLTQSRVSRRGGHEEACTDKLGSEQEFQVKPLSGQLAACGVQGGHSS